MKINLVVPSKLLKSAENILSANLNTLGLNTKSYPCKLTISVTDKCNKQCLTCDIWKKTPRAENENLSVSDFSKLFANLNKHGLMYLELTGGEPFLRNDLDEIAEKAFKKIDSLQFITITTNGYDADHIIYETKKIMEKIPDTCSLILGISIDGDQELHDLIKGVPGSYDTAVSTLTQAYELQSDFPNLKPHVSYTINSHNVGLLEKCHKSLNIPIDDFSFSVEHNGLLYCNNNSISLDEAKLQADLDYLKANPRKVNTLDPVSIYRSKSYDRYVQGIIPYLNGVRNLNCAALKLSGYIDEKGGLYPCIMWDKPLGNIKDSDFVTLWDDSDDTRALIDDKMCPGCWTPCEVQPSLLINMRHLLFKS